MDFGKQLEALHRRHVLHIDDKEIEPLPETGMLDAIISVGYRVNSVATSQQLPDAADVAQLMNRIQKEELS